MSEGWHPKETENELELLRSELDACKAEIVKLRLKVAWEKGLRAAAPAGDPEFHRIIQEIADLHAKKNHDYGTNADPYANVRASEDWGMPAWVGSMIRACDKIRRLQTYAAKGVLANEGVEDAFLDLATYAVIGLVLFRQDAVRVGGLSPKEPPCPESAPSIQDFSTPSTGKSTNSSFDWEPPSPKQSIDSPRSTES